MADRLKCGTKGCEKPPDHRFTWPGHDEQLACDTCAARAVSVATAMGFYIELRELPEPSFHGNTV